jgi:hypothetical protein
MINRFVKAAAVAACIAGAPALAQAPQQPPAPIPAAEVAKIKADVIKAAHDYLATYSKKDAKGVAMGAYSQPSISIGADGVSITDPAKQMAGLETTFKTRTAEGWVKSAFVDPSVCVLNPNTALMTSHFRRYDKDNKPYFESNETALYARTPQGWRMVGLFGHQLNKTVTCSD